ncbi:MAG: hypothetical protein ACRCU2_19740, partial [Planktothrix sp.]
MSDKAEIKPTPDDLEIAKTTEAPADLETAETIAETTEAPAQLETTETIAETIAETTEAPADLETAETTQPSTELETTETTQPPAELETAETTQPPAELEIAKTPEASSELKTAETTEAPAELETPEPTEQEPESETSSAFFQAVGILPGEVSFEEGSIMSKVTVGGKEYRLLFKPRLMSAMVALKLEIKQSGSTTQRLIVYPKVMHFPKQDQPHQLAFQLV